LPQIPEDGFARDDRIATTSPTNKTMMENVVIRIASSIFQGLLDLPASIAEDALSAQVNRERDPERDERGDEDDGERCHRHHP
jgi:hypothetical protein